MSSYLVLSEIYGGFFDSGITLSNLQHCDCEKETEFEFYSVKQNTVEEFEFECNRCGEKVNLKSSIPVVS